MLLHANNNTNNKNNLKSVFLFHNNSLLKAVQKRRTDRHDAMLHHYVNGRIAFATEHLAGGLRCRKNAQLIVAAHTLEDLFDGERTLWRLAIVLLQRRCGRRFVFDVDVATLQQLIVAFVLAQLNGDIVPAHSHLGRALGYRLVGLLASFVLGHDG